MKLTPVIAALRARCPYFENRVAGAAQFKNLPEVGKLKLPAAYVVPGDDSPGENKSQTDYWQELKEGFSVVVILSNGRDERGQFASYDVVDDVRQMLFKALLGWNPEACGNPITYDGGTLLDLNRHELIYQFDFSVISELTEDDTRQRRMSKAGCCAFSVMSPRTGKMLTGLRITATSTARRCIPVRMYCAN